jgi:hypothetical protein
LPWRGQGIQGVEGKDMTIKDVMIYVKNTRVATCQYKVVWGGAGKEEACALWQRLQDKQEETR